MCAANQLIGTSRGIIKNNNAPQVYPLARRAVCLHGGRGMPSSAASLAAASVLAAIRWSKRSSALRTFFGGPASRSSRGGGRDPWRPPGPFGCDVDSARAPRRAPGGFVARFSRSRAPVVPPSHRAHKLTIDSQHAAPVTSKCVCVNERPLGGKGHGMAHTARACVNVHG